MTEMEKVLHEGISCVTPMQWKLIIEHMYQESRGPLLGQDGFQEFIYRYDGGLYYQCW